MHFLQNFKYVPKSHFIDDSEIIVKRESNKFIKKHSYAHKCGLNYAPKRIVGGVDLNKAKRFKVPKDKFFNFKCKFNSRRRNKFNKQNRFAISFSLNRRCLLQRNKDTC